MDAYKQPFAFTAVGATSQAAPRVASKASFSRRGWSWLRSGCHVAH